MNTSYKVLITTSGTGSRLGELTIKTNKALIKINDKTVISYIVESYPKNIELVITLGYYGEQVKTFLEKEFSDRIFTFVNVDKYEGEGTSLGYSMLQAKSALNCPFIFHCNDTIVTDPIPEPNENWNGGSKGLNPEIFNSQFLSSVTVDNGYITSLQPKGALNYDYFHIGLVGIKNYHEFWEALEKAYQQNPLDNSLNDCSAIRVMLNSGIKFRIQEFVNWYDTGNPLSLSFSKKGLE